MNKYYDDYEEEKVGFWANFKAKFKKMFETDYDDEYYEELEERERDFVPSRPKLRQAERGHGGQTMNKPVNKRVDGTLVLVEPRTFDDANEAAHRIKLGDAVIINLQRLDKANAQRTVDFLTGVIFALEGEIKKVSSDIIMCTPSNILMEDNMHQDEVMTSYAPEEQITFNGVRFNR